MARATYSDTPHVQLLRQLVKFAEDDEPDVQAVAKAGRGRLTLRAERALDSLTPAALQKLQREVREFLLVASGAPLGKDMKAAADIFLRATRFQIEISPFVWLGKARPRDCLYGIDGTPRDVLLHQAMTVLELVGPDRLRVCPAPDCGRLFVKIGRREYCSNRCQRRVFISTYNPFQAHPRRKDHRHGKATRQK